MTHLNLAKPKAWRPSFPDTATGTIGRKTIRPHDPREMEDFDPDATPPMPRPALRIEGWDAEESR